MSFVIAEKITKEIDRWVSKYPEGKQRSAVVQALTLVQEQNGGWLSEAALNAVADYLNVPPIQVYEVATFYDMYELQPVGQHKIAVCTNLSCQLRGSEEVVAHLKKRLGVGLGETTSDGKFSLREVECMAACDGAPMCQVDDKQCYTHLTPESIDALLEELKRRGTHD